MRKLNKKQSFLTLIIILIVGIVIATGIGAVNVPILETTKILLKNIGIYDFDVRADLESIIFYVRFPRVIVAAIVGAALAISGAVMQGMFRNPMADPGIIGVSSGASLGAVIAIALGLTSVSMFMMPIFASVGAIIAVLIIYMLSARGGKIPTLTLILAGIALSTFLGAISNLILTEIADYQVQEYLFWSVGGLNGRRWEHVTLIIIPISICVIFLLSYARDLNILALGEEEAQAVGLNPTSIRKKLILFTAITTAMAVCVSGNISFVGLIVPHIMRIIVGSDHRILLPASALAGAIFLVFCDLIGRTVMMPSEVGVGIITSLLGAPYFIFLLSKARKEGVSI